MAERITQLRRFGSVAVTRLAPLPEKAAFAYTVIAVLQLRMFWGIWRDDLQTGDSPGYFADALRLLDGETIRFAWSPLYAAFVAPFEAVLGDPALTMPIHRLVISLAAALLTLAILRRLLPSWAALVGAAWWASLPVIYDTVYEIHLFGALPLLIAILLLCSGPELSWQRRGAITGLLLTSAVVIRNEGLLVLVPLGALFAFELWWSHRGDLGSIRWRTVITPIVAGVAVAGAFYFVASERALEGDRKFDQIEAKHRLNVCQAYYDNFRQRNPAYDEATKSECGVLMQQIFGEPMPTFREAWQAEPVEMAKFAAWNLRVLPQGIELAMFGKSYGDHDPGLRPSEHRAAWTLTALIFLLILLAAGGRRLYLDREYWGSRVAEMRWGWAGIAITFAVVFAICMFTQGFRAPYMFGMTIGIIAFTGLAAAALVRAHGLERRAAAAAAVVPAVFFVLVPIHFISQPTPVRDSVEHVRDFIEEQGDALGPGIFMANSDPVSICQYSDLRGRCRGDFDVVSVFGQAQTAAEITAALDERQVGLFLYSTPRLGFGFGQAGPGLEQFIADPQGWEVATSGTDDGGPWQIYVRTEQPEFTGAGR